MELGSKLKRTENADSTLNNFLSNSESYRIYTDGSKVAGSNSVGSACICRELNISIKRSIPITASVFTAECIALNDALDISLRNTENNIQIFTDSLSALLCLQNPKIDIKTNFYINEIKKKYNEFNRVTKNSSKIELFWIPSHTGIEGNEHADTIAKTATEAQPDKRIEIPFTDFRETYKYNCKIGTQTLIEELGKTKGKEYFQYYYKNNLKPWFAGSTLSREIIVTINRCRSNHYHLAASLSRVGIIDDPKCDCNHEQQDINHVVWQCPLFDAQRGNLIQKLNRCGLRPPWNIKHLLVQPNTKACTYIYYFLKECNLKV